MKLVCKQSDLNSKLSLLSRIVPSNPTHPVLANVLLSAQNERLGLTVFDLSLGIQVWIAADVEEIGSLTLPARFLSEIVSRLPNCEIQVQSEGTEVTLTYSSGHYQMQGLVAEEFPELPTLEKVLALSVPSELFQEGLQATLFAASTDESKQILTGLHLNASESGFELATTDGHRLAIAHFPDLVSAEPMTVTIPAKALRELERMLGRVSADVALRFDTNQATFELTGEQGTERLSCRLLEGQYPAYPQLMPKQFERQVTVERQLFLSSVERIAVLAARKNNIIRVKLDNAQQQVALSAEAPELGVGEETLPAQISGDDLDIAFNAKYLSDGLRAMGSKDVQLQLNSATMPVVLSPLSGQKITYLIMPIQIRS
ncbi:MAG: DNA polymerase III subunit beta [Acaryochloris sp. RU_4_1]|nr:DNA polymerase III subunit beta [Acaryochloris sp. RU_4_1]NJR53437.1 DNA polymerase III subunit beta [Acaryochloris sp. CRU_2_0]